MGNIFIYIAYLILIFLQKLNCDHSYNEKSMSPVAGQWSSVSSEVTLSYLWDSSRTVRLKVGQPI